MSLIDYLVLVKAKLRNSKIKSGLILTLTLYESIFSWQRAIKIEISIR